MIFHDECMRADMNITNSIFDSNYAIDGGSIFTSQDMNYGNSKLEMANNTFRNNTSIGSGAIFSFVNTKYSVKAFNNSYIGNSATISGGVGYVNIAALTFTEIDSTYLSM